MIKWIILLGLFSFLQFFSIVQAKVSSSSSCSWTVDGHTLDLSELEGESVEASDGQFTYTVSICDDDLTCNGESSMAIQENQDGQCVASLASWDDTDDPTYSSDDGGTWEFTYSGDEGNACSSRTLTLIFICDSEEEGDTEAEETEDCEYQFTLYTSYACVSSSSSSSGMSGGSVFLLILFLALVIYCLGGYGYNAYKHHQAQDGSWKDYKQNVPHLAFWMTVPLWTKAGCEVSKEYVVTQYHMLREKYAGGSGGANGALTTSSNTSYQSTGDDNM